jgi:hypothetical protein
MDSLRPYPTQLQRGTLLLLHAPDTHHRLTAREQTVHAESIGIAMGGAVAQAIGWMFMEPAAFAIGGILLAMGLFSWIFRLGLLRQRAMNIPGMLFVSKEGIEALLPDTRSTTLAWEGLQATSITFFRHISPRITVLTSRHMVHRTTGLALRSASGTTIYVVDDLEGYNELLDILAEMGIQVKSFSSRLLGAHGTHPDWRGHLETDARQWRN